MAALVQFLKAVQNDARADIDAFLAALEQESANKRLAELSDIYHFKTFWDAQMFDGNRVMQGQDLAQLMSGTKNIAGLGALLRRYGLDLYRLGTSKHDVWRFIKVEFNISRHTSQVSFATYRHLLMAGMKGETDLARRVCAYLLDMEEQGRMAEELQSQKHYSATEILRQGFLEHDKRIEVVEQDVREAKAIGQEAKVIAIDAQRNAVTSHHTVLRLKKSILDDNEARLRRAQTYLPSEVQARMRSLLYEFCGWHCLRCHREVTLVEDLPNSVEIDEVHPRAHGGNRTWDNIQALCKACNILKRDAAKRGEFMGRWDFCTPLFLAACDRERRKYERRMNSRENPLEMSLFPDDGIAG